MARNNLWGFLFSRGKMIRSSQHTLKFSNDGKLEYLEQLFQDYQADLQDYIDLIWEGKLPLKILMSSKNLPALRCKHSQYKSIIYKQASEIIRSQRNKKIKTKPEVKNISIILTENLVKYSTNAKSFDEFIQLTLPYKKDNSKWNYLSIRVPIKQHKQSLKFKDWTRKKSVQLRKINGNFYLTFFYEKEQPAKKEQGASLGIDIGYKKLIATSDNQVLGKEMIQVYDRISRKVQGSKNFKQSLKFRDYEINRICNELNLSQVSNLYIEALKNVKHKSKFSKKFNHKLQRWSYQKATVKIERLCEEQGIELVKVSPAYTSQTCSKCGFVDSHSRKGETFECTNCKIILDADYNASLNILHRGVIESPLLNNPIING